MNRFPNAARDEVAEQGDVHVRNVVVADAAVAAVTDMIFREQILLVKVPLRSICRGMFAGRSVADLVLTLKELNELGVGFVSLTEALDLTTPAGRAMAGLLAVFAEFEREILRERVRAGIAQARKQGKPQGRPRTAAQKQEQVKTLFAEGVSKAEIARRLAIGRTSVRRLLAAG